MSSRSVLIAASVLAVVTIGLVYWYDSGDRVQSAADCTSVETYDAAKNECYYECDTDEQCAALARQVQTELDQYFENAQTKAGNKPSELKDVLGTVAGEQSFISQNGTLAPAARGDNAYAWDLFTRVTGDEVKRSVITKFITYNDSNNDTAAAVWRGDKAGTWNATVNLAYKDDVKDLVHTMVHEYGHIVTLSVDQVPALKGACPRFELSEGCSRQDSYINAFHQRFWQRYGDDIPANDGDDQNEVSDFYQANGAGKTFVSEYAATNPSEDIAESFATFVLQARPDGASARDNKIGFFYEYPELVSMRDRIRGAVAQELSQRKLLRAHT